MNVSKKLTIGFLMTAFVLTSCSLSPTAQIGYEKAKEDIKSSMRLPSTYRGEKVACYYDNERFAYVFQYKITFSGENAFGGRNSATVYYGFDGGEDLISYGSDSTSFAKAQSRGEEKTIFA